MDNLIVSDPGILGGKPCIKGTRISIQFILELLASGATRDDILQAYPHLSAEQVTAALDLTQPAAGSRYPLRGTPIHYHGPMDPVGDDWEALR